MINLLFLLAAGVPSAAVPSETHEYLAVTYPRTGSERCRMVEAGMVPILNMDDYLLLKITNDQIPLLPPGRFQVLDSNPSSALYYLVRPEPGADLSLYGKALFSRRGDCLLKVDPGAEETLWRTGWRLRRLGDVIRIKPREEPEQTGMVSASDKVSGADKISAIDTMISAMVDKVDSLNYLGYVRRLQNFKTRYSTTDSCKAAAGYLGSLYRGFGLSPFDYHYRSGYAPSVIATQTGVTDPQVQVIICGHFDATNNHGDPTLAAPGADDNGSGTLTAVEIARIFKRYRFARTVKFINFSGEEQGLFGSLAYADSVANIPDSIIGVFNLDMIAHVNGPESLQVIGDSGSTRLADTLIAYAQAYVPGLATNKVIKYYPYSDHAPFEDKGYQSVLGIELSIERGTNPTYHSPADTIGGGFNSLSFATKVIKAVVAAAAGLAKPVGVAAAEEKPAAASARPSVWIEPDPNRGRFSILYSLAAPENFSVAVYNAAGARVGQVWDGRAGSGNHRLSCDVHTLPAGVYFLTFKDKNSFLTRRFTCVN